MRAEIFLAAFLGGLLAIFVYKVFVRTVVWPLSGYLIRRMMKGRPLPGQAGTVPVAQWDASDELVSVGPDYLPPPVVNTKQVEEWQRHFQAQQELCMAAIDARDGDPPDRMIKAARLFRDATPARQQRQMRAQLAFRKAMAEPTPPPG